MGESANQSSFFLFQIWCLSLFCPLFCEMINNKRTTQSLRKGKKELQAFICLAISEFILAYLCLCILWEQLGRLLWEIISDSFPNAKVHQCLQKLHGGFHITTTLLESLLPGLAGTKRNMNYEVEEMVNPVRNQGPLRYWKYAHSHVVEVPRNHNLWRLTELHSSFAFGDMHWLDLKSSL